MDDRWSIRRRRPGVTRFVRRWLEKHAPVSFTSGVQFELRRAFRHRPSEVFIDLGAGLVRLAFVRNPRAKRYVLRLRPDGCARVTVPRGGSLAQAHDFAKANAGWLARQICKHAERRTLPREWRLGTEILLHGEQTPIRPAVCPSEISAVQIGPELVPVRDLSADLRLDIEFHLRRVALRELPPKVYALAAQGGFNVNRVTIRSQRSRWGSCSRKGTISLNWRLIQAPGSVRDYIIIHELCHLRQMNHSPRFWRDVESIYPEYRTAERWLKEHSLLLR